jgi:FMN-dependent oxidoreductase (nitrilotriacetate monooxygenase family)
MTMARQIRLNAFDMNCVGHQSPGLWTHPRDRSSSYSDLGYWTDLARTLERGLFDGIFLADVLGVYDVYGGTVDAALRASAQVPVNDPALLVPAMALVTEHLGFGLTATLSFEPPYQFARRMSTLDHLTRGRVGWNIVTGYLNSAARGTGADGQEAHDVRYDIAAEYMEVVYKLWEGSWEDGAVVRDRARPLYTQPDRVHRIVHRGDNYRVDAIHLSEPSPQRTPVLYQAGASSKGVAFAAGHAECVFIAAPSTQVVGPRVAELRRLAAAAGRDPGDILVFTLVTVVLGATDADAWEKFDEYRRYVSREGALALLSGWTGIDFAGYALDDPITYVESNAVQSLVEAVTQADPDRVWTVGELAEFAGVGGVGPVIVGSPATVADELERWVADADVDGFNLAYAVTPETFEDAVDLLVPELQRRGVYKTEYAPGTLREKLFRRGARLAHPHPAAGYRVSPRPLDGRPATDLQGAPA